MMTRPPIDVNIQIGKKTYTVEMMAVDLDSALEREKKSKVLWKRFSDPRKEALAVLVGKLLSTMHENIGDWLPSAFGKKTPALVEISFKLFISDIDMVVAELEYQEQLRKDEAIESLSEMLDGNQTR